MLPQFLSQMLLNEQTMKLRDKMLTQERGYELEKSGYTSQAPEQEGIPQDASYVPPPPRPDIEVGGKGYYAPKTSLEDIKGLPGYKALKVGNKITQVIDTTKGIDVKERMFAKGIIPVGDELIQFPALPEGGFDWSKGTRIAGEGSVKVGSPKWMEAQKELASFKAGLKEPKDDAVADLRKFELVQYGKLTPELRGTKDYQDLYKKFKQSPFTDALERQIELTAKTQGTTLRKEFYDSPEVKTHQTISQQFSTMQEALKESKGENLVAVDQALITIMNKMMDPQSVVRESEYARTPGDLALINRVKGAFEKIQKGGAGLTDEDRKAIAKIGKKYYEVSQKKYKSKFHEYSGYLSNYGLDPEKYLNPADKGAGTTSSNPLDKYME
jgi:hypothetical protein